MAVLRNGSLASSRSFAAQAYTLAGQGECCLDDDERSGLRDAMCAHCVAYTSMNKRKNSNAMHEFMMYLLTILAVLAVLATSLLLFAVTHAHAHDHDPSHDAWYKSLHMPDVPSASCCGPADAYWCDDIRVEHGKTFCLITDIQDDAPLGRIHVDVGTKIEIPPEKLKYEQDGKPTGNPTGHSIVFLSRQGDVYCFVQDTGI